MVAYYLNCLLCGCGWGPTDGVPTNVNLAAKYYDILFSEFPTGAIENALYDNEITQEDADALTKSFKRLPEHDWMSDVIAILPEGVIDVQLLMEDCYQVYAKNVDPSRDDIGEREIDWQFIDKTNYKLKGYIMHKHCCELLKKNGYDMSYETFCKIDNIQPIKKTKISEQQIYSNAFKMDYGIASEYIGEYGVFYEHVAYVHHSYLLEDPLQNMKNANRILNLDFPFKKEIPNQPNQQTTALSAPSASAAFLKFGTKRRGNDGCMWVVVEEIKGGKEWKRIEK